MFARAIAKKDGVYLTIADAKQLMTVIDDVLYEFLTMVDEKEPVEIKAFNGITISANYVKGGRLGTGAFSGKKSKPGVKVKAEVTKYAKDTLKKDLLEIVNKKIEKRKLEKQKELEERKNGQN